MAKEKYDWRYENSIHKAGSKLIEWKEKPEFEYIQYRTNLNLSNFTATIYHANFLNMNYHLDDKLHYHYCYHGISKARNGRFSPKRDKKEEDARLAEDKLISLIQEHYKYSVVKAKEALRVLTEEQINTIRKQKEKGGVSK
jgi:hypothetical protein